jgi:CHAD domain-containing protein
MARLLRATAREIDATVPRVRGDTDEEAIHDLRVAVRRMRVLLKIARRVWYRPQVEAVRAGFTKVHRETSSLRDEEVLRETLTSAPLSTSSFIAFRSARARLEAKLRADARRRIRAGELDHPQEMLRALLLLPGARAIPLDRFAIRVHDRLLARVVADLNAPIEDGVALHELRIACKNLRYATELLGPVLGPDRKVSEKPAARFQKHLGEVHDLDVALDIIGKSRTLTPSDRRTLAAWLRERRARRTTAFVEERAAGPFTTPSPVAAAPSPPVPSPSPAPSPRRARSPKASPSR